jgi:hypothetical protein
VFVRDLQITCMLVVTGDCCCCVVVLIKLLAVQWLFMKVVGLISCIPVALFEAGQQWVSMISN